MATKEIVRKADGKDWKQYLRTLAEAKGIEDPSVDDLRWIHRGRKELKMSSSTVDARIARMNDGTTHLAYRAEHAVDLEKEAVLSAQVTPVTLRPPRAIRRRGWRAWWRPRGTTTK